SGEAGRGGDNCAGSNLADRMAPGVGDINRSARIESDAVRLIELGGASSTVQDTGVAGSAGKCADGTRRSNFADEAVTGIGDVDESGVVHGDALWRKKAGTGAGAVRAAIISGEA